MQKSLKHEIWSSTVLGNKRLDAAFRESAEICPIYLFYSVNGSRHFCGVAQMLTPWVTSTACRITLTFTGWMRHATRTCGRKTSGRVFSRSSGSLFAMCRPRESLAHLAVEGC